MKGFTLIELLVVVLIIGILASVALPQYTKAVMKSRAAEAWTNLKNLNMAATAYCLENPSATSASIEDLDIEVPYSNNFGYKVDINCSTGSIAPAAGYWQGPFMGLYVNPKTGTRSCVGARCSDIGFTNSSTNSEICTFNECGTTPMMAGCGVTVSSSCYYAN